MTAPVTPDAGNTPSGDGGENNFTPITSQDDLNRIIGERVARVKSQYADYEDLKTKASAFDEAEQARLSDLDKAIKRAEKAEKESQALKFNQLRFEVASDKSVPANLLSGSTKAELEASADALIEFAGAQTKARAPMPNPTQGRNAPHALNGDGLEEMLRQKLNIN